MLIIALSFAVALVFEVIPLSVGFQVYNPPWVALILIYWCWYAPSRIGVVGGFLVGLLLDVVKVEPLGLNALALALIALLACRLRVILRPLPILQQSVAVLVVVLIFKFVVGLIKDLVSVTNLGIEYWLSTIVVFLAWPLIVFLLKEITSLNRSA